MTAQSHGYRAWRVRGCRCEVCRAAMVIIWARENAAARDRRAGIPGVGRIPKSHGRARYRAGCRCEVCTEVETTALLEYRVRRGQPDPRIVDEIVIERLLAGEPVTANAAERREAAARRRSA
jgi:hypothetical protein